LAYYYYKYLCFQKSLKLLYSTMKSKDNILPCLGSRQGQQRKKTHVRKMEQWALLILLNSSHIWSQQNCYYVSPSFLPRIIIIIIIIIIIMLYSRPLLGRYLNFFNKLLPALSTWKKFGIKELWVWGILITFRIYPLVAHCLWSTKRSCKAPHGASMVIWTINFSKMSGIEKDMAIQSLRDQKYPKQISKLHLKMDE
jgi:hypothetical protein